MELLVEKITVFILVVIIIGIFIVRQLILEKKQAENRIRKNNYEQEVQAEILIQTQILIENNINYCNYEQVVGSSAYNFEFAGINFRNFSVGDVGKFDGRIVLEDNPKDKYAMAILNSDNKHIGYLPGKDKVTHSFVNKNAGEVKCYGYIMFCKPYSGGENYFRGRVFIPINQEEFEKYVNKFNSYKTDYEDNNLVTEFNG